MSYDPPETGDECYKTGKKQNNQEVPDFWNGESPGDGVAATIFFKYLYE